MLTDERRSTVPLGDRLGRGGEGEVFAIHGQPTLVAKVLSPARRAGKAAKLRAMLANAPPGVHGLVEGLPVLTWPRGLLLEGGDVVGYTMTRVQATDFVPWHQVTSAARRTGLGGNALTFDKLVTLGLRLAHVVATLHRFGYAVGDLNDRNVSVSRRLTPLIMDTDSFQVPGKGQEFACTVGDALYWPPELLDIDLARHPVDRTASDRYALAVLLFQLFLAGLRPYQSRGSQVAHLETLAQKTKAGHYPWSRPRPGVLEPPAGAPSYEALPKPLRTLFERAFVDGHRRPGKRPTAQEWVDALARLREAGFHPCAREGRHAVPAGERACPWCSDPNDPFTARKARVVPVPRKRRQAPVARVRPKAAPQLVLATAKPPMAPTAPTARRIGAISGFGGRLPKATSSPPNPPMPTERGSASAGPSADRRARSRASRPKAKAPPRAAKVSKPAARASKRPKRKRRPAHRARWPSKARWMTLLTSALLAAWWLTS